MRTEKSNNLLDNMQIQRVKFKDIEQVPYLQVNKNFKQDFQGSSPTPFIGRFGYPNVHIGLLSPQISGDTSFYDAPKVWSKKATPIGTIASMRYGMVNSRSSAHVKEQNQMQKNKFLDVVQEVGMASKPVEMEVQLKQQPRLAVQSEKEIIPFGPQAEMRQAKITQNPFVDSRVERVVGDTDLKASSALLGLYQKGFEENFLTKLLSVGNLGLGNNRKLVPTRWSITATDDTIGKQLITEIKDFSVGEYQAFFGGGWGNYYLLLFFPEVWSYELFEMYIDYRVNPWSKAGNFYSTDYESYEGRKEYAEETAGGYYAARLAVVEKMKELKHQHSCLALRFITSEYTVPLGVWVCREAAKKSTQEKAISFTSQELMLKYAEELLKNKFNFDVGILLKESKLLTEKKTQRRLGEY